MTATPEQRIAELGLALPEVAAPVADYVPVLRSGNYLYVSGQLPFVGGKLSDTGKVGGSVSPERAKELAATCALNVIAALKAEAGELERIARLVKLAGFVASEPSFTGQPQVLNGASELFGAVFGAAGTHARSAVGVAVLPLDSPVELEAIAELHGV